MAAKLFGTGDTAIRHRLSDLKGVCLAGHRYCERYPSIGGQAVRCFHGCFQARRTTPCGGSIRLWSRGSCNTHRRNVSGQATCVHTRPAAPRRCQSASTIASVWSRWRRGESISDIGRALDRAPGTIHYTIRQRGGIAPPDRCRSRLVLTLSERQEISRGVAAGHSARRIAAGLGRSPSTITRELDRHGGRRRYPAAEADQRAWQRARRPKPCLLLQSRRLRVVVAEKLAEEWSPEQISG